MRKPKSSSMTEDILKIDQALLASMRSVRLLAERLSHGQNPDESTSKLRRILDRKILVENSASRPVAAVKPKPLDTKAQRMGRLLASLPESQVQIVLDITKSMVKQQKAGPSPKAKPKPDSERPQ